MDKDTVCGSFGSCSVSKNVIFPVSPNSFQGGNRYIEDSVPFSISQPISLMSSRSLQAIPKEAIGNLNVLCEI